jgi:hypothetical protein
MSLFLHKDCGQVLVVNGEEEEEASPPSYPLGVPLGGTSGLRIRGTPPEVFWTSLPSRISSNVVAPAPDKMPGTTSNKPSAISRRVRGLAPAKRFAGVVILRRFSGSGRTWGRRRPGLAGCWSCDFVVVRRVVGTASRPIGRRSDEWQLQTEGSVESFGPW